jgi:hypothetical protein
MATGGLEDPAAADGGPDGALEGAFGGMVASDDAATGVDRAAGGGEEVLPAELAIGVRILRRQGMGQMGAAVALLDIVPVEGPDAIDLLAQGFFQGAGQQGDAVLRALAVADDEMALAEVDVLDPEAEAFQQSEAGAVEQAGHQSIRAVELVEDGADLVAGQDRREPLGPPGRGDPAEVLERPAQDLAIEEEDRMQGLILGGGGDIPIDREVGQERLQLGRPHLQGMALAVE